MCSVMLEFHTCFSCMWVSRPKCISFRYLMYVQFSKNSSKHLLPLLQNLPACVNMTFHLLDTVFLSKYRPDSSALKMVPVDQLHPLIFLCCLAFLPDGVFWAQANHAWILSLLLPEMCDLSEVTEFSEYLFCHLQQALKWNEKKMFIQRRAQHLSHRKGQK